jgi:hypothetical protein
MVGLITFIPLVDYTTKMIGEYNHQKRVELAKVKKEIEQQKRGAQNNIIVEKRRVIAGLINKVNDVNTGDTAEEEKPDQAQVAIEKRAEEKEDSDHQQEKKNTFFAFAEKKRGQYLKYLYEDKDRRESFTKNIFHHLWFLWFLCWLVIIFAIFATVANKVKCKKLPNWLMSIPGCLLWLIPLTIVPQWFMHQTLGPDTFTGLILPPHTLFYYSIFFLFGALYHDRDQIKKASAFRGWSLLCIAVLIFPIAFDLKSPSLGIREKLFSPENYHLASVVIEATYVWVMTFAWIELFRYYFNKESKFLRYVSDSSYWMYLAHMPLVFLGQHWLRNWEVSPFIKFGVNCVWIFGVLLLSYHFLVRYTPIGAFLNGLRNKSKDDDTIIEEAAQEPFGEAN